MIVLLCYPMWGWMLGEGEGAVALLRLMRLMRIAKLLKKVPQLNMIVMGLVGGLKSIGYIAGLLFLAIIIIKKESPHIREIAAFLP